MIQVPKDRRFQAKDEINSVLLGTKEVPTNSACVRSKINNCESFFPSQKRCADSQSVCPTPRVIEFNLVTVSDISQSFSGEVLEKNEVELIGKAEIISRLEALAVDTACYVRLYSYSRLRKSEPLIALGSHHQGFLNFMCAHRPGMTFAVDWALKPITYLSFVCSAGPHCRN